MGRLFLAAFVLLLLSAAAARSEDASKKPVSVKFFDRNTRPTTDGNNAMQSVNPIPQGPLDGAPPAPRIEAPAPAAALPPRPELWPVAVQAVAARRAKVERETAQQKKEADALAVQKASDPQPQPQGQTYSLWEGQAAPRALPAKPKVLPTDDAAAQSGQQLYDGAGTQAASLPKATPSSAAAKTVASAVAEPVAPPAAPPAEIFVAVELDLKTNAGQYRDAVADLGRAAAFRPDHRFELAAPSSDHVSLWGWMAPGRLAQAMGVKGVTRLHVEPARLPVPRPMPGTGSADSRYIIGIKVPDQAQAAESAAPVLKELAQFGFRLVRTLGTQAVPGGELALVVEGTLPVRGLSRVMANVRVLKVIPAESETTAVAPEPASQGFLLYASQRAPLLLVLTLLLLVPPFGGSLLKLCEFFIPYQR